MFQLILIFPLDGKCGQRSVDDLFQVDQILNSTQFNNSAADHDPPNASDLARNYSTSLLKQMFLWYKSSKELMEYGHTFSDMVIKCVWNNLHDCR